MWHVPTSSGEAKRRPEDLKHWLEKLVSTWTEVVRASRLAFGSHLSMRDVWECPQVLPSS